MVPSAFEVYQGRQPVVALPDYARFVVGRAGMPRFEGAGGGQDGKDMTKADFADSAVATVRMEDFRPWLTEHEWESVVRPFTDVEVFKQKVLADDWEERASQSHATCREPRLTVRQQRQLFEKGYVRRVRRGRFWCTVFAVWKSDGVTIRLIWNGKEFNKACQPPPGFTITPLPEMLRKLLQQEVKCFLTYDATTWFLQFAVPDDIAAFFGTKLWGGREVALLGVPMGAAWACALAQTLTIALARAVEAELVTKGVRPVAWEFCIDNSIIALRSEEEIPIVKATVREVAEKLKVVLKESAYEVGSKVEWLVYNLDAERRRATFKAAFVRRLEEALERIGGWKAGKGTVHDAWSAGGLALFVRFAGRSSMREAVPLLRWMASNTPSTLAGWAVGAERAPWELMASLLRGALGLTVRPPPCPPRVVRAWFVTDAATSGSNAIVLVVGARLRLMVYPCERPRIEAKELHAHVRASLMVVEMGVSGGYVVGYGDNTVALVAQRRGHAAWADDSLSHAVEQLHKVYERKELVLVAPYVTTHRCVADVWTRVRGLALQKEWKCEQEHDHHPGIFCTGMQEVLMEWMTEGEGGAEKMRNWRQEEESWVVRGPTDLLREGSLTRRTPEDVKYKM